jgi:hypothetical protein
MVVCAMHSPRVNKYTSAMGFKKRHRSVGALQFRGPDEYSVGLRAK